MDFRCIPDGLRKRLLYDEPYGCSLYRQEKDLLLLCSQSLHILDRFVLQQCLLDFRNSCALLFQCFSEIFLRSLGPVILARYFEAHATPPSAIYSGLHHN